MMFPKPCKQPKEAKPYNSLRHRRKDAKPVPEWKQGILAHHKSKSSTKDRAEFPREVVEQLKAEAGGKCQCCKRNPDTTTHHVVPRAPARGGRGVKTNGLRLCLPCHHRIQTNIDELNYWIDEYLERYGFGFWFDQEDWIAYNQKKKTEREAQGERKQRMDRIGPIVDLLSIASGRTLKAGEVRLIDAMDDREVAVFAGLMRDVIAAGVSVTEQPAFGYGQFKD